jgi:D-glycero-alpha-D-manno-heptose-7-phosphate kinase
MAGVTGTVFARAPLRIALGGGGTDLASHYAEHGGFALSAAIDRHVRMRVSAAEGPMFSLQHLERESVEDASDIGHPILRAAIARHGDGRPLDLASEGDVEPGTGLGSSGAYAVCAVKAVGLMADRGLEASELAEAACAIEIDDMGRTVGKQDQYASTYGGMNAFTFARDGTVQVHRLELPEVVRHALRERFLLFFTGHSRSAADILSGQVERTRAGDATLEQNLLSTAAAARASSRAFETGDLAGVAELMNEQWRLKRERRRLPAGLRAGPRAGPHRSQPRRRARVDLRPGHGRVRRARGHGGGGIGSPAWQATCAWG